jgi:hypothetical protein
VEAVSDPDGASQRGETEHQWDESQKAFDVAEEKKEGPLDDEPAVRRRLTEGQRAGQFPE